MTTWNSGAYPPPDPNQYYGGQPTQQPYPGAAGYPPQGGFPAQGGYPPPGGYGPQGMPYGSTAPPGTGGYNQAGENTPFSNKPEMYGTNYEDGGLKGFDFSDKSIRRGFIRKVYSILMCQLLVTLAFIALFLYHTPTQRFVSNHPELFIVAIIILIVSMIALSCCGDLRRKAPQNFIFLGLFTIAESFFLGITSSTYKSEEVVMAVGLTAAVCLGLTLFAFQTKWDFTIMGGFLFVTLIIFCIFGFVAIFVHDKILTLVYASIGALLFCLFLIYDTQMMMGGNHKYSISPEEYIFAALNLYIDVINIFIYILTIFGASRD